MSVMIHKFSSIWSGSREVAPPDSETHSREQESISKMHSFIMRLDLVWMRTIWHPVRLWSISKTRKHLTKWIITLKERGSSDICWTGSFPVKIWQVILQSTASFPKNKESISRGNRYKTVIMSKEKQCFTFPINICTFTHLTVFVRNV